MSFKPDQYIKVKTVEEVTALLQEYGEEAAIVAGGTELHELAERGMIPKAKKLIDIEQLGLNYITSSEQSIRIGATTKLCNIRDNDLFKREGAYTSLSEAATILPLQIVELATIDARAGPGVNDVTHRAVVGALADNRVVGVPA